MKQQEVRPAWHTKGLWITATPKNENIGQVLGMSLVTPKSWNHGMIWVGRNFKSHFPLSQIMQIMVQE